MPNKSKFVVGCVFGGYTSHVAAVPSDFKGGGVCPGRMFPDQGGLGSASEEVKLPKKKKKKKPTGGWGGCVEC